MAKDIYHDTVKAALLKDGWSVNDEFFRIAIGSRSVYIDLGAEKIITAEKEDRKIAVEIKSFLSPSPVQDLENALGQYILYRDGLKRSQPERILYLAIIERVYLDFFQEEIAQMVVQNNQIKLITFDSEKEEIIQWIG
ncbi:MULTISPECIES: element excision factor XisH family protein [Aerosakkonema]|uniref:element excision factor XisH family protein n=1 Tax=Aerosakkonema TaxID=1246629 RepID=UPI0035B9110F